MARRSRTLVWRRRTGAPRRMPCAEYKSHGPQSPMGYIDASGACIEVKHGASGDSNHGNSCGATFLDIVLPSGPAGPNPGARASDPRTSGAKCNGADLCNRHSAQSQTVLSLVRVMSSMRAVLSAGQTASLKSCNSCFCVSASSCKFCA